MERQQISEEYQKLGYSAQYNLVKDIVFSIYTELKCSCCQVGIWMYLPGQIKSPYIHANFNTTLEVLLNPSIQSKENLKDFNTPKLF